jgi:hypothetical protein
MKSFTFDSRGSRPSEADAGCTPGLAGSEQSSGTTAPGGASTPSPGADGRGK